ncbi:MAG: hypothetical protein U0586_06305 [Candidatus Brocadiaceae bacterium]
MNTGDAKVIMIENELSVFGKNLQKRRFLQGDIIHGRKNMAKILIVNDASFMGFIKIRSGKRRP